MSKRSSNGSFLDWGRKFYSDYLDDKKNAGGWCEDYVNAGLRAVQDDPAQTGIEKALLELAAKTLRAIWHDDPEKEQLELFSVADVEIEGTYTWFDPTVPSQHRRVLGRWATPRQVDRDALLTEYKAQEAVAAATKKRENAAKIMARVRDPDALLWDFRDTP